MYIVAHIFFDDAFQPHNNNGGHYTINSYVKQLIQILPQSIAWVFKVIYLDIMMFNIICNVMCNYNVMCNV